MQQNIYDRPDFFAEYSKMRRSIEGLDGAGEWHEFRAMLPDLHGKRVLDLGCGFGWHCRYAVEQNAKSVIGVDLSEKMLARARTLTNHSRVEYRQSAIEELDLPNECADVVISSLTLHYIERFDHVSQRVYKWLAPGGAFVMSVEHPMFTALAEQDWCYGPDGERRHWPVDNYQQEGIRHAQWIADDVVKYHRTVATYINTLVASGFCISKVSEPTPPADMLREQPDLKHELRRPMFLMIGAIKGTKE